MKLLTSIILLIILTAYSCNSVKPGVYKSTCEIYHVPQLILFLNENKTFEYKRPYVEEKIVGTWEINENNELILKSDMFNSLDELNPDYKFTDNEGADIYKISGNKLLVYVNNDRYSKRKCYLVRVNDKVNLF
jgi:hypothetical protein